MRTLWVVVLVLLVGASGCRKRRVAKPSGSNSGRYEPSDPQPHVSVPNTPEGNQCKRDCMGVSKAREFECLLTCPGAKYYEE